MESARAAAGRRECEAISLPLPLSYAPMEARSVEQLPEGKGWQYEPKWDGFRCLAFRDGDMVDLRSKSAQPLARYFPDLVAVLRSLAPRRFVLDGEIVIPIDGALSFEELQLRLHPAASRVAKLAAAHPCRYIVFDLLVGPGGDRLTDEPLSKRRGALDRFFAALKLPPPALELSPATTSVVAARRWLDDIGIGLDGIIAKRRTLPYASGERDAMVKYKTLRTADCVVGGFRFGSNPRLVGSLLLGLYGADGKLNHAGFTSSIAAKDKPDVTRRLEAIAGGTGFTGKAPGGPSRWSNERSAEWHPVKPRLVVEVRYDHVSGGRFRHGTRFLRWRPDKAPEQCRMDQIGLV
jgi:ATP-dependent DNA ligase